MCTVEGCDRPLKGRRYCNAHNERLRRLGTLTVTTGLGVPTTSIVDGSWPCNHPDGCTEPHYNNGYCRAHAMRLKRTGNLGPATLQTKDPARGCTVKGCDRAHRAGGLCAKHFGNLHTEERRSLIAKNPTYTISHKDHHRLMNAPCMACGATGSPTMEHLIPVTRGGTHGIGNLTTLCKSCNSSKNNLTWMEWRTSGRPLAPTPDTKAH